MEPYDASFLTQPVSTFQHHGEACCRRAVAWVLALDKSLSLGADPDSPPTWLRERYEWGPLVWPVPWCQVPEAEELDCGALAALALELLLVRSYHALPAQLAVQYPDGQTSHWRERWAQALASSAWIDGNRVYHEAVAVIGMHDQMRIWDPTDGSWLDRTTDLSAGAVEAVRVASRGRGAMLDPGFRLTWDGAPVEVDRWTFLC
jgi:hypothetical protein